MGLKEWKNKIFPQFDVEEDDIYAEDEEIMEMGEREEVKPAAREKYEQRADKTGTVSASRSSIEMKVVTPTKFDAVTQIADLLLEKKTVLLNLENTNKETAKRLIDFLSGVAYALDGDVQKVADNTFAVTPHNVAVSNEDVADEFAEEAISNEDYE